MGIVAQHVKKVLGEPPTIILKDISLEVSDGAYVAVTGRSGSGKSSLLYVLSSLDQTSGGMVEIDGRAVHAMSVRELSHFRNQKAGFVFQFHYLLAELSAIENVLVPARKNGGQMKKRDYGMSLLEQFGLAAKCDRFPRQLSGGEQQRVAIARALVMEPRYLFADEPTGSLDSENSEIVFGILRKINREHKTTIVFVTHDAGFASRAERQIHLVDGEVVSDSQR